MLTDISFDNAEPNSHRAILEVIHGPALPGKISKGFYLCQHWNFEVYLSEPNQWPDLPCDDVWCYGVCDNPQQLLARAPWLETDERRFVVSFVKLDKADEPPEGGWRWRKWGEYIGTQSPQCEYLADEPEIETVYTYHIYEVERWVQEVEG